MTSPTTGIKYTLILKILFMLENSTAPIDESRTAAPGESDSPNLIKGVSEKPLGLYIDEYPVTGDRLIKIFDLKFGLTGGVIATLDSNEKAVRGFPHAPDKQKVHGHEFDPSDVERVTVDDKLIWRPVEMREDPKEIIYTLQQGIITIELLDYPELVRFIQENREAFARIGLRFDK